MKSAIAAHLPNVEELLGRIADEFTERLNRGEEPEIEEYAERHAEIAPLLRQVLPALRLIRLPKQTDLGEDALETGILGDFRIMRELGRGGMGVVYKAEQISLGRKVALKVLPFAGALDPRQITRFQNEARAAACLHHPNIVPVYAVGCERAVHFYAMQYIEGQSLERLISDLRLQNSDLRKEAAGAVEAVTKAVAGAEVLRSPGPPGNAGASEYLSPGHATGHATAPTQSKICNPKSAIDAETDLEPRGRLSTLPERRQTRAYCRRVAELGIEAAQALEHAHELGVVHRDIKPANLMLDGRGKLWMTDFGLAQIRSDTRLTLTGDLVGTLRYMSPEQALAKRVVVDHRTDIYSLGATLYELLTLEPVFPGADRQELLRQIAFEEPKPPRRHNKSIPPELETIVLKALEKNPADRYATAKELAEDLERFVKDEPIKARRPSLARRLRGLCRRHKAWTAGAAMLALALVAIGGLTLWWQERLSAAAAASAKKEAEAARASEAEIKAVLEFVENRVFAAARPEGLDGGLGHEVTLRRAIEASLPFLAKSFADQPLIEARLRKTVGNSFNLLGDAPRAAEQHELARALYSKHRGPDHPDTLSSMHNLATSYALAGRYDDAFKLCEETLALRKAKLGPYHPDTLKSMENLASNYRRLGRPVDALKLYEQTLALYKVKLGPEHPGTLMSMHNLAEAYDYLGRLGDALKLREETLALAKVKLGLDHPSTLLVMSGLAVTYSRLGRHADALKLNEETLALMKAKLGPDHPHTIGSMVNLALSYESLKRLAEALELFEETLSLAKAKLGPDHPTTLHIKKCLTDSYSLLGRHADALKLHEELLAHCLAKLGPGHQQTIKEFYEGACSAALLGCGQGDGAEFNEKERARLRGQAISWLRSALTGIRSELNRNTDRARHVELATQCGKV